MGIKLKLILEKIHWSLLLKSLFIGLSWFLFPFWLFFLIVSFFYFFPIFRPINLLFQFIIFVFIALIINSSFLSFLFLTILIFLILGIKDLIIIHREIAYEFLGILFFFILGLKFFENFGRFFDWVNILLSLIIVIIFILFFKNKILFEKRIETLGYLNFKKGLYLISFLVWQLILVLILLPLNFYLQTAILILFITLSLELIFNYSIFGIKKQFILANSFIFFIFLILILIFNKWSL